MNAERPPDDRRRSDRRSDDVRLADFTVPELRKAVITAAFLLAIAILFGYMVADVAVAIIAGVVLGAFLIPFHDWLTRGVRKRWLSAILAITVVMLPLIAVLAYSWIEIADAAGYLEANSRDVVRRLTDVLQRIPFVRRIAVEENLSLLVAGIAARGDRLADEIQDAFGVITISIAVFLTTVFYILTEHERVIGYLRAKVPGRYRDLERAVSGNIRAVVYGALYATFLTQIIKSAVVLTMNLVWGVPLAIVLAIVSFFIGFLPIVGSWAVYVPVGLYLIVFRGDAAGGVAMILIGFLVNTVFMSLYLRPKIAAEKSHVLNFYWMFIALVTGVYTFGLVGVIIGPVLIGVLKAIFETVTGEGVPVFLDGGTRSADRFAAE
ncbi:MAG TPA: AI-2E family transporter [Longimicrobiales bacterium]